MLQQPQHTQGQLWQEVASSKGYVVDARLLSFAFGMHCAQAYKGT